MEKNKRITEIRTTEIFTSIQGEGIHVGEPSVFLRMPLCNMNCPGFGRPRGSVLPAPRPNIPEGAASLQDLAVPTLGCDSSPSWDPAYRSLWATWTVPELALHLKKESRGVVSHLVVTGGEPLLPKTQRQLATLLPTLRRTFRHITFETNGTQVLSDALEEALEPFAVTFSVSPKLSISGEPFAKACNPKAVRSYERAAHRLILKFVVRDHECLSDVTHFQEAYASVRVDQIMLMPEGATVEGLVFTEKDVADLCLKHGYRYSPRLHVALYGNTFGT